MAGDLTPADPGTGLGGKSDSSAGLENFPEALRTKKKKKNAQTPLGCFVGLLTHVQRGEGGVGAPLSSPFPSVSFPVVAWKSLVRPSESLVLKLRKSARRTREKRSPSWKQQRKSSGEVI